MKINPSLWKEIAKAYRKSLKEGLDFPRNLRANGLKSGDVVKGECGDYYLVVRMASEDDERFQELKRMKMEWFEKPENFMWVRNDRDEYPYLVEKSDFRKVKKSWKCVLEDFKKECEKCYKLHKQIEEYAKAGDLSCP